MRLISNLTFCILILIGFASFASEVISGCQGEGCSCFLGYRGSKTKGAAGESDIKTIRPFTLYKKISKNSKVLGKFEGGTKARPIKQELMIEEKGEYLVEADQGNKLLLKKDDKIDTLINLGERFLKGRKDNKWIEFDYQNLIRILYSKIMRPDSSWLFCIQLHN